MWIDPSVLLQLNQKLVERRLTRLHLPQNSSNASIKLDKYMKRTEEDLKAWVYDDRNATRRECLTRTARNPLLRVQFFF
jgi:hypothetical protein